MKNAINKTLGIKPDTHARLKAMAQGSGIPITSWLDQVVGYFYKTGLSPDDLDIKGGNQMAAAMKKQLDLLVRLFKSQEKKLLTPMAQSVLEMQYAIQGAGIWIEMGCPVCRGDYRQFIEKDQHLSCGSCGLRFRIVFGKDRLGEADILTLLSGGMTRRFENLKSPDGEQISCRFYLDPSKDYTLNMQL